MYPQCTPSYTNGSNVYTCNNVAIATTVASCEWTAAQKAALRSEVLAEYASEGITASDILDDASTLYNCHTYAWHLTEGYTNQIWINQTNDNGSANLSKYWSGSNACFIECTEASAEKIFYYSGDHSAVKSTVSGKYESKWGKLPLIRHDPTSVPSSYQETYRRYYKKIITITGPSSLCTYSSGTFTASGAPSGYTWTCSSNLTPGTISGNSRTFQANTASTSSWVAIYLNSVELARFNFVVADGPIIIATPQARTATVNVPVTVTPSVTGVTNYRWAISPATSNAYLDNTYGSYAVVTFSATGSFALYGYGIYPCGESGGATVLYTFTVSSSASYSMSAYPNPVSGVLNVDLEELDAASEAFSTSGSSVSGSGGISRARPVYTISLYSVMGMLALQTVTNNPGNIQLDVSSLPSGIYTLRVHDGTDSPPVTQQIVISH